MRQVFLENLPKKYRNKSGNIVEVINWKESIGCIIKYIYDDLIGEFVITNYSTKGQFLSIENNCGNTYSIKTGNLLDCKLGNILGKHTKDFKVKVGEVFDSLIITDRKYKKDDRSVDRKWYSYTCKECGYKGNIIESQLLNGTRCSCCCYSSRVVVEGINDIATTDYWAVKYFPNGYDEAIIHSKGEHTKIKFICPYCKRQVEKGISINKFISRKTISCPCRDGISKPNKVLRYLIYKIKEIYDIKYEFEYKRVWSDGKSYDGYIEYNNTEYLIEMDGGHHKRNNWNRDEISNDKNKDRLAEINGYKLIRIDCEYSDIEFISNNIINSELSNLFDLTQVDWLTIDEQCQNNIVKQICGYWESNSTNITTEYLCEKYGLCRSTIIKYLKIGNKYKWCKYDSKEEMRKNGIKNGKSTGKPIYVLKDNIIVATFNSLNEAENLSVEVLGVKLYHSNIYHCLKAKQESHQGYKFKFA